MCVCLRLSGCFYVFRLQRDWGRVFAFDACFTAEQLDVENEFPGATDLYLGATTMPMGYRNAMGLIQYGHRRAHRMQLQAGLRFLPLVREVRKDHAFPIITHTDKEFEEAWEAGVLRECPYISLALQKSFPEGLGGWQEKFGRPGF